ncbi:MAG: sulfotransferase, partial [Pseudomonadota bacterium]
MNSMKRFTGDGLPKRAIQAALKPLGYKMVQLEAYQRRQQKITRPTGFDTKIFGIGFNKTATTTLGYVMRDAGLRMPKQLDQEIFLDDVIHRGDWQKLRDFCSTYDAFQDLPFSQNDVYIGCDALFPGARFILTERDPIAWADSFVRYYRKSFDLETVEKTDEKTFLGKSLYLKSGYAHRVMRRLLQESFAGETRVRWDLAFDKDFLIDRYQRRDAAVKAYFAQRPNDLLVLDLCEESDTGRLLRFLGADPENAR